MSEVPQRILAQVLRAKIDIMRRQPYQNTSPRRREVRELIERNPHNARTRHVQHTLGKARLDWLVEHLGIGLDE